MNGTLELAFDGGAGFLLSLPRAVRLSDGDGLQLEQGGFLRAVAGPEPLVEARAQDAQHLARLAWHIGNRHTAIREDASINLAAVDQITARFPGLEFVFVESGGDNLSATFSPELADLTIYVIDVSAGDKIPRKGGPGDTRSDLLVINKIDLAPHVGADLALMARDAAKMRGVKPVVFSNMRDGTGLQAIVAFLLDQGGFPHRQGTFAADLPPLTEWSRGVSS